jgi:hypothetical protein
MNKTGYSPIKNKNASKSPLKSLSPTQNKNVSNGSTSNKKSVTPFKTTVRRGY